MGPCLGIGSVIRCKCKGLAKTMIWVLSSRTFNLHTAETNASKLPCGLLKYIEVRIWSTDIGMLLFISAVLFNSTSLQTINATLLLPMASANPPFSIYALKQTETFLHYLSNSRLWFESFQNWAERILSVFTILVHSIFLCGKGSSQSKLVDEDSETGA